MKSNKKLNVKLNNELIGYLEQNEQGKMSFYYTKEASRALSIGLPIKAGKYEEKECKAYFGGLLPEGDNVRIAVGKKYGVNPKNDFSLLKSIGYDCAGAVSFYPFDAELEFLEEYIELKGDILSEKQLSKYIDELPIKPLATGYDGIRLSLAGAQEKTAVISINDKIMLPKQDVPTTHILKPAIKDLKETIENEYICLRAAEKIGIIIPKIKIRKANKTKYFLIERYDRIIKDKRIKRIHQEDFCQASNIASAFKYQREGGVSLKNCFDILKKTSRPALNTKRMIAIVVFNFLIGNNDAHGKNFSLLHYDDGNIELAPAYDILCTKVYKTLTEKMAMKIGGKYEFNDVYPRHWELFAKEVGISYTQLKKVIKKQTEELPLILKDIINKFDNTIGQDILAVVENNCKVVQYRFKD